MTGRLHRREVYEYTAPNKQYKKVICGQWQSSTEHRSSQAWTQNFEYLRKTEKHVKLGPGQCNRVACWKDTGVWWCNEVTQPPGRSALRMLVQLPRSSLLKWYHDDG